MTRRARTFWRPASSQTSPVRSFGRTVQPCERQKHPLRSRSESLTPSVMSRDRWLSSGHSAHRTIECRSESDRTSLQMIRSRPQEFATRPQTFDRAHPTYRTCDQAFQTRDDVFRSSPRSIGTRALAHLRRDEAFASPLRAFRQLRQSIAIASDAFQSTHQQFRRRDLSFARQALAFATASGAFATPDEAFGSASASFGSTPIGFHHNATPAHSGRVRTHSR